MREQLPEVQPLNSQPQERNRITAVLNVYHEQSGEQPKQVSLSFSGMLEINQESYSRRLHALSEWAKLDCGWVHAEDVGFIVVENIEGKHPTVNPTEKQKAEIAARIIEIAFEGALDFSWPVPPQMFFFAVAERAADLRIRCRSESAQYRITVLPR
jgi:hypothetical protein